MPGQASGTRDKLRELREIPGVFSFQEEMATDGLTIQSGPAPQLDVRPGGIVEWLVDKPGAGGVTSALQISAWSSRGKGVCAIVDQEGECYVPALSGWGIDPSSTLLIRPATLAESCWAIEQCLRCPGVSSTLAWVSERIPERVHRRWQLAAERGGGVGLVFRPIWARWEPVWADLRLLVEPQVGGQGETRRVNIEVLYRRGGKGGGALVWEIDHAAGTVCVVPQLANPAAAKRAARA
jgi:hypothetical protein